MPAPHTGSARSPDADSGRATIEALRTALAQAQRALHASNEALERTRSALSSIADGMVLTDTRGRITCLNPIAAHLTGWTEDESLGRPLRDVVRITDAQGQAVDLVTEGFFNGDARIVSLVRRDGHVILIDGNVAAVHCGDGRRVGSIVTFRNVTAATRMSRELAYHANHDPLTGLLNRRVFDAQLQRAVESAAELGCHHALLYFDLDRFKAVNDRGGHVAGDELLRQLAIVLRRQLREHDTLARLGGDEFAVLLENCTPERAGTVAEKIRTAIAAFAFSWAGRSYRLGASIGQVVFCDDGRSAGEIVEAADRMCYVAKTSGRNRVAVHETRGNGGGAARQVPRPASARGR